MSPSIRFLPEAKVEFDDAVAWYERKASGLGKDLIAQIRDVLLRMKATPRFYAAVHGKVRKAAVRRFPYLVIYQENENEILILAIFHASRDPSIWHLRVS